MYAAGRSNVTISWSVLASNFVKDYHSAASGGACCVNDSATLSLINTTVRNNDAQMVGGGVSMESKRCACLARWLAGFGLAACIGTYGCVLHKSSTNAAVNLLRVLLVQCCAAPGPQHTNLWQLGTAGAQGGRMLSVVQHWSDALLPQHSTACLSATAPWVCCCCCTGWWAVPAEPPGQHDVCGRHHPAE